MFFNTLVPYPLCPTIILLTKTQTLIQVKKKIGFGFLKANQFQKSKMELIFQSKQDKHPATIHFLNFQIAVAYRRKMPEIVFLTSEKNMPLSQTLYHITHPLLGRLKQKKTAKTNIIRCWQHKCITFGLCPKLFCAVFSTPNL